MSDSHNYNKASTPIDFEFYQGIRKMGSGAFGVVYKAKDIDTLEEVALKVIS